MSRDVFRDREQAEEAAYFAQRDAALIEKIRARAKLSELAHALAAKLQVDDPALLERIARLGVTLETSAAFLLAPLVEVAWADGHASQAEQDVIVRLALRRGVASQSPDMTQLHEWLKTRPPRDLCDCALDALKLGLSVLPKGEAQERITSILNSCQEVAEAARGLEPVIGARVSPHERVTLDEIRSRLGAKP